MLWYYINVQIYRDIFHKPGILNIIYDFLGTKTNVAKKKVCLKM
jgi:hypothetical protein